jgi:hypothetical protein
MGRAALTGAISALVGVFPLAAICALTIGIPVPFSGGQRGVQIALESPWVVLFYGIAAGGFPIVAALGAVCGVLYWRFRGRSRTPKLPDE